MLMGPDLAGVGMGDEALRVAVAIAENLGLGAGLADERIVGRHAAVIVEADDFAGVVAQILGAVAVAALTGGDVEMAGRVESETRAEVPAAAGFPVDPKNHFEIGEGVAVEAGAGHFGAGTAAARPGVGQVDPAVGGIVGVEDDVEQAALAGRGGLGHAADGRGVEQTVADDA